MNILGLIIGWKFKLIRWTIYTVLLIFLALLVFIFSFDLSKYHTEVEQQIYNHFGVEIQLEGDSRLSWQGGPALKLDQVLYGAAVFEDVEIPLLFMQGKWPVTADEARLPGFRIEDVKAFVDATSGHIILRGEDGRIGGDDYGWLVQLLPAGDDRAELECLYLPIDLYDDRLVTSGAVLETGTGSVIGNGEISLKNNKLDVIVQVFSKKREREDIPPVPMKISGTLDAPRVSVDPAEVMRRTQMLLTGRKFAETIEIPDCSEK